MAPGRKRQKSRGVVLRGFVFGHYDSRGGTIFVEARDLRAAKRRLIEAFLPSHCTGATGAEMDSAIEQGVDGELVFRAHLLIPRALASAAAQRLIEEGRVLEPLNPADPRDAGIRREFSAWFGSPRAVQLEFVPRGARSHLLRLYSRWPRWADDGYGFLVVRELPMTIRDAT